MSQYWVYIWLTEMEVQKSGNSPYIKAINKEAVHRICSGQVVLNLAVAVKELVENSLDAGATVIEVRLRDYGSELVEVTDNGSGVEPDNFQGLTLKHHTSKLQDFSDLVSVETFGFRGEALSSLCSLSDVTVTTRHVSSTCGTRLVFDHSGMIKNSSSVARQAGTTVSLENIFSTLPVRQKEFHKNLKREFSKMTQLLYAYCLVSTNVKITCTNQTKKGGRIPVVSTQGCKTVKENITCVFGSKQLASLLDVKTVGPSSEVLEQLNLKSYQEVSDVFMLEGLVSSCGHGQGRGSSDRQFYYVNSRPCEPTKVMKAVNEVYHQYNAHQQPFVYLNICSARDSVDVNVTPDKRQVFLEHEKLLIATVKASLQALYENIPSTYKVNNVIFPSVQKLSSPPRHPSTPSISAAALLSQWHRSSPSKRPSSQPPAVKLHKQIKLSNMFAKSENKPESIVQDKKISLSQVEDFNSSENQNQDIEGVEEKFSLEILYPAVAKHVVDENEFNGVHSPKDDRNLNSNTQTSLSSNSSSLSFSYPSDEFPQDAAKPSELALLSQNSQLNHELLTDVSEVCGETSIKSCNASPNVLSSSSSVVNDNLHKSLASKVPDFYVIEDEPHCNHENRQVVEVSTSIADLREYSRRSLEQENLSKQGKVRFRAVIEPSKNKLAEEELSREISKDMFAEMEVLGQFNLGFIIAKLNSDLFIIDQHATDEKYNFETLQRTTTISNQKLVVPQQLEVTAVNESILIDNIKVFNANGFDFEIDENAPPTKKIKLTSIPMSHNWTFGKEDIDELLFMLQDAPSNTICRPSRVRAMFASRACRKSVMIGTALSKAEMKRLLTHMGEIEQPWNCPHGRPTMRHLINLDFI